MDDPKEYHWAQYASIFSLVLFCVILLVWISESYPLIDGGADFGTLRDLILLDLFCSGGMLVSWLIALAAATQCRTGVWVAMLEAPLVLVAVGMGLRWFMG